MIVFFSLKTLINRHHFASLERNDICKWISKSHQLASMINHLGRYILLWTLINNYFIITLLVHCKI